MGSAGNSREIPEEQHGIIPRVIHRVSKKLSFGSDNILDFR
jgi:hypothetical protein